VGRLLRLTVFAIVFAFAVSHLFELCLYFIRKPMDDGRVWNAEKALREVLDRPKERPTASLGPYVVFGEGFEYRGDTSSGEIVKSPYERLFARGYFAVAAGAIGGDTMALDVRAIRVDGSIGVIRDGRRRAKCWGPFCFFGL
jgi:hypothetical protein